MSCLRRHYKLKVRGVLGAGDPIEGQIVNLNGKHANRICDEMGAGELYKGLDRLLVREIGKRGEGEVSVGEATRSRAQVATANYLAADRPDIQLVVREICREMAAPMRSSMARVKRSARYLAEYPRLVWHYGREENDGEVAIHVFAGSDWTGWLAHAGRQAGGFCFCSRGGGQAMVGHPGVRGVISLVRGAPEGLGVRRLGPATSGRGMR